MATRLSWPMPISPVKRPTTACCEPTACAIAPLLDAILPLLELDPYVDAPLAMMAAVPGDTLDPAVEAAYRDAIERHTTPKLRIERIERFAFYERARMAFAVVMTGETAKYGNIILKKGVTPA